MATAINLDRWIDNQVPVANEIFVDHTANFVVNLDHAANSLNRLGFVPSPLNLQSNLRQDGIARPSGTSNRLVRLRRGFLEFLAATHDTPIADQLHTALVRYEGLHLIAFSHVNLASQRQRLAESGFAMQPMIQMRRRAEEFGVSGEVSWSILRTEPGEMSEGRIQYVYPHTPDLTWPPGSMTHPNAADSLTGVMICVADPIEARQRYEKFLGRVADGDRFKTDRGVLRVMDCTVAATVVPKFAAPSLPFIGALSIQSIDLDTTADVLRKNQVTALHTEDGRIWLGPHDALGSYLCFHAEGRCPF